MAINLKKLSERPDILAGGHAACAGCAAPVVMRQVTLAAENPLVCGCATGCMEVVTTIFPTTAWRVPFIHNAFENSAATMSGVEAAYRALKRRGKIPADKEINFIAFGGDGGTYDIGFQSLSGMLERGHKMLYVCYDNEAYMNTGIQRSSATPKGAATMTAQAGSVKAGKEQNRKDLTACVIAHNPAYVAQASPHNFRDLMEKVQKALRADGPAFMCVLAPCHRGWRFKPEDAIDVAAEAVETCFWPLFEWEKGKYTINYKPKEKKPLEGWLKRQGRFSHLFEPANRHIIDELQAETDRKWNELLKFEEMSKA
ncbi:MAG TPA: thiamine pyrophosphate-dependent enzyme [Candidatus Brocadiia bacterium]|nr:thiamine pyrophosphate-dependent enzyme [Candidatus Brocadiia bacterium]